MIGAFTIKHYANDEYTGWYFFKFKCRHIDELATWFAI
jgi:hypothetical protein